ncbi:PH, RCC1 and FYVE domains-containing protein [Drosera capensis]
MADLVSYAKSERDVEQALVTLKKGTQLLKYSRKGKPKFRPFRLSADETTLIWYSHGEERNLKLSSVSKILLGQRTPVFRRFLRPEKDYLSFSLIYKNGERSLDLICKDKEEVEVWLAGLKALVSTGQQRSRRTKSEIVDWSDGDSIFDGRPSNASLEFASSIARSRVSVDLYSSSDVRPEHTNMQLRGGGGDGFRLSVSSTPSCSSQGSGQDDIESLGDVYVWGELWYDGTSADGSVVSLPSKVDVLTPKPLESNVVLDVHQIACGARHIALVTRQGEVFTWGEESGGRLGHGIERDFSRPQLVEFLAVNNVDFVSCGEYHTCAVSTSGDLYTWGDGTHNAGVLGHGTDASHWIPKRVSGALEGHQVLSIACGTWHTALVTSSGKLFTFGDGQFGVLGHGGRESFAYPREVQQLSGLRTIKVACGVWHTAAIVEVIMNTAGPGASISSRKLFTWGDGDKYRLGHGSKDTYLTPTCVSTLIDYNFHQIACGHTMTVALTTSGHVFTMGSTAYGQLGNPQADGKMPCVVQDKLVGEFVEEISCGAFHVAVLTSRTEVFTWGKGANGRLGQGDVEDRKSPTLVEAVKDRHVKSISCGSNFTATVCLHKWVSGADQSVCSGCRQAFGFTRKRHNCYNCGIVHCHACSSKKALRAALAPTPGKPHRVCDACYNKLKASANNNLNLTKKATAPRRSLDSAKDRSDREEARSSGILLSPNTEPIKYLEIKTHKPGNKCDSVSMVRASQVPSFQQLKDIAFPSSLSVLQSALKPVVVPPPPALALPSTSGSRPASPYSRRPSPPRSVTPVFSRGVIDSLKKSNELLSQEVAKLQNQVKFLKQKCKAQDEEIEKLNINTKEATLVAEEQSSKSKAAREVLKSMAIQLKEIVGRMPADFSDTQSLKAIQDQAENFLDPSDYEASEPTPSLQPEPEPNQQNHQSISSMVIEASSIQDQIPAESSAADSSDTAGVRDISQDSEYSAQEPGTTSASDVREPAAQQEAEDGDGRGLAQASSSNGRAREAIEQFEPGVYVTTILLRDDTKIFKRVRFSKRRYSAQQAEEWWRENKERVLKRYLLPPLPNSSAPAPPDPAPAEENNEPATPSQA